MRTVFDGRHLRLLLEQRGEGPLVAVFDSLRHGRRGFDPPRPESFFAGEGLSVLRIATARNDWFLNPDLPAALEAARTVAAAFPRRVALGFSMGGYGALRFAAALGAARVIATSPQASPIPERAPWEGRWAAMRARLPAALDDLSDAGGREIVLLHDPRIAADRAHVRALRGLEGAVAVALPFGGHPATGALREARMLAAFNRAVVLGPLDPPGWTAMHRRARRASAGYAARRAAAEAVRNQCRLSQTPPDRVSAMTGERPGMAPGRGTEGTDP